MSGKNSTLKFYQVIINQTPDISEKAGVDMMVLPSYKLYKDGAGPVKSVQGSDAKDLLDIIAAA
ncbi:uncharacterized protein N7483_009543 [Penicillium malachiteum]|uniref:uncharacterized protein n=1 Tax=Penicillium malachiteum TaxID=1324776 RepID=UPI002546D4C9|nr:uncharacterized protein N7483_009543 [Penicillium malachiteum]KAJ5721609.1 hypothetical protein N7483_009543 [Penicillium malachiteum]